MKNVFVILALMCMGALSASPPASDNKPQDIACVIKSITTLASCIQNKEKETKSCISDFFMELLKCFTVTNMDLSKSENKILKNMVKAVQINNNYLELEYFEGIFGCMCCADDDEDEDGDDENNDNEDNEDDDDDNEDDDDENEDEDENEDDDENEIYRNSDDDDDDIEEYEEYLDKNDWDYLNPLH